MRVSGARCSRSSAPRSSGHVQGFPRIPGQKSARRWFPGLVAAALVVCGAILLVKGLRARRVAATAAPWFEAPDWLRSPRHVLAFVVLVACNVFYLLAVDTLGFVLTAFVYLSALMWVLRVRARAGAAGRAGDDRCSSTTPSTSCCACRCPGACCKRFAW